MKTLKTILAIGFLFNLSFIFSQQVAYVTADSGLTIRENPDVSARKIGKLYYGESLEIIENTKKKLVILDNGESISGEWVKINTPTTSGYVFNGYLTENKVGEILEFHYPGLSFKMKDVNSIDEFRIHSFHNQDSIKVTLALGETPENKIISIFNKDYKRVSIFQRYETSATIMNEGPHCDLTNWEHFNSEWRPIEQISKGKYNTLSYSETEWQKFVNVDIDSLKKEVRLTCGEEWFNYIKDVNSTTDYPVGVSISRIFLKFLIIDSNNKVTEKLIEFEIPMGC